ncbi:receptor-like protein 56 [Diospyros lotus]|uniref:receptor-like protein 56 n=1 Tax=Diospyros lotus TaxID=55363 RepID=UPI00225B837D|nr:receptor-like protein 56 [Diospyros lotus]
MIAMASVLVNGMCCFGCLDQEKIALLNLKASINYPNGVSLPSWVNNQSANCCQWERVECNNTSKRVIQLSLYLLRDWTLGDWYFNASLLLPFEELKTLDLSYNFLAGWVESEGFARLSKLHNLEFLNLGGNSFDNSIITSIASLSSLKSLDLSINNIEGSTYFNGFARLSRLQNLEFLNLAGNRCNNSILRYLDGLSSLRSLDVSFNDMTESIHINSFARLSKLRNLEFLNLRGNNFSNSILTSIGGLSSLKSLDLSDNDIKGLINFSKLENLSILEDLFLDHNIIKGGSLRSIRGMISLRVLSMRSCGLIGRLPTEGLCEMKTLQELNIFGNKLWGDLPWCLANLTSLRLLDISSNDFSGNIAASPLINLTSLEYLALSNNGLQVPISLRSFFNHSKLKLLESLDNKLVAEEGLDSSTPSFQLNVIRLSDSRCNNCSIAFPYFLYHQTQLQMVELSQMDFKGKFPNWLLENNTGLVILLLPENSVNEIILPLHPMKKLFELDISSNHIQGCIPSELANIFPSLIYLDMSANGFKGDIPSSFGDLIYLQVLDLSNNQLSGKIPIHLATGCKSFGFLSLSNNNLTGPVLPAQSNLFMLQYLFMDYNNFTEIPPLFSRHPLVVLDVGHNQLLGKIPRWIGNMRSLVMLSMDSNHFEGSIPVELCDLNPVVLDLSNNYITGTIPSCMNLANIEEVWLSNNRLSGPFPEGFRNSTSLKVLDISNNRLRNDIPKWIGNLSQLQILLLKNNNFEGNIPNQICHLSYLTVIDLSLNNFFGHIPPCLGITKTQGASDHAVEERFYVIMQFQTPLEDFKSVKEPIGDHYDYFPRLENHMEFTTKGMSLFYRGVPLDLFSAIDLSNNKLTGHIPPEIGNLSHIQSLNLSHNSLIGAIPTTFSNLKSIESLDLSYNNLNGNIPYQLISLYSLEKFNVSYNHLSGRIPQQSNQFETFDSSSFIGNPLLCGEPLPNNCNPAIGSPPSTSSTNNGSETKFGFINIDTFYMSFAGSYIAALLAVVGILYINPQWRKTWFYLVEVFITSCYYFIVDNLWRIKACFLHK